MKRNELSLHRKEQMAASLKKLMTRKNLGRITIQELADDCGINRYTFYYHFRDKQELVDWIFHTDLGPVLRNGHPGRTWNEALTELLERLQRSRAFYAGILRNQGQDRFSSCLFGDCYEMVCALLAQYSGNLTQTEQEMAGRFYTRAVIGLAMDWVRGDIQAEPAEIVTMLQKLVHQH